MNDPEKEQTARCKTLLSQIVCAGIEDDDLAWIMSPTFEDYLFLLDFDSYMILKTRLAFLRHEIDASRLVAKRFDAYRRGSEQGN